MPRLGKIAILSLAVALTTPVLAQNTARVQHVIVRGTGDAMEVEIQTSGAAVAPNTQAITGPDRIVVDFPGALPASELRALKVNRGALKAVRSGLFFANPPITRIVLDLSQPQTYRISTTQNLVVVKLGPSMNTAATNAAAEPRGVPTTSSARLQNASLASATRTIATGTTAAAPRIAPAVSSIATEPPPPSSEEPAPPPKPAVTVTYEGGMLHIRAERATLAQVLFEVQRQTRAEIGIPAGAEQEQVFADIGPAPSRDVLGSLLNGSPYNFIFVGNESSLERVILTRRDPSIF